MQACHTSTSNYAEVTQTTGLFQEILPDINIQTDSQVFHLGAPVSEASIKPVIESKVQNLRLMKKKAHLPGTSSGPTLVKKLFLNIKTSIYTKNFPSQQIRGYTS